MSASNKRASRGFTLSEMLTVIVIMGIFTTFVVAIIAPVVNAPNKEQAKIDTLQAAGRGLYDLQRDLRMADITGIYACSGSGGSVTCSQPSSLTSTNIIAIVSPVASGQLNWSSSSSTLGLPAWQGVVVYWLDPNGSEHDLDRAYVSASTIGSSLGAGSLTSSFATTAATAVSDAQSSGGMTLASDVNALSTSINTATGVVGLQMTAQSTEGSATNSTQFSSSTYVRN